MTSASTRPLGRRHAAATFALRFTSLLPPSQAEVKAATSELERLVSEEAFSTQDLALLHGQMPTDQKEAVLQLFKNGEVKVLVRCVVVSAEDSAFTIAGHLHQRLGHVATCDVCVCARASVQHNSGRGGGRRASGSHGCIAVRVPRQVYGRGLNTTWRLFLRSSQATIMIIEHAERFGFAQLHQLRGRVGRSHRQSYCYLVYGDEANAAVEKKMKVIKHAPCCMP